MNKLKSFMDQMGYSNADLAKKIGCTSTEIWRLAKYPDPRGRSMTIKWANRIAPVLGIDVTDLLDLDDGWTDASVTLINTVPVIGEAAAGRWLERNDLYDEDQSPLISGVIGRYPGLKQFSYKISGKSMDLKRIHHGDFVICVPYYDARTAITSGDIVVVERHQGQLTERTVKEILVNKLHYELWPRSTDKNYQKPLKINIKDGISDDGITVEIVGLVIGVYTQI
jgi:SOS-response transcriptional repressor LexA